MCYTPPHRRWPLAADRPTTVSGGHGYWTGHHEGHGLSQHTDPKPGSEARGGVGHHLRGRGRGRVMHCTGQHEGRTRQDSVRGITSMGGHCPGSVSCCCMLNSSCHRASHLWTGHHEGHWTEHRREASSLCGRSPPVHVGSPYEMASRFTRMDRSSNRGRGRDRRMLLLNRACDMRLC